MDQELIKYFLLGVVSLSFIFEKSVNFLNATRKTGRIPATLDQYLEEGKLQESKRYQKTNYYFGLISGSFTFVITLLFIGFGFFGWLDEWLRQFGFAPLALSVVYFGVLFIGSDLLSLPFDYYHTFKIEADYGFNNSTVRTFFADKIKGYLLSIPVGGGLLLVLLWLILEIGSDFWWIFWMISALFIVLVNQFYSGLILPLFNKLTPLEAGELKRTILGYAQSVGFSLENVFIMDGSKRSTKANAFFSGFGKRKKVVLYDTLLEQHTPDEVVAVLAHEIGHYKKGHITLGVMAGILQTGIILYILSLFVFNEQISLALGGDQLSIHLNIIGFTMLFSPISLILGMATNYFSRKHEFEADAFAKSTYSGKPLAEALKTLSVKNLSDINPHPLFVFVNYSHPPLLSRLKRLE
ncbi:STE24 endopeptidase [Cyclobacterium xiamenense]|uniref:STE24 endopeptidase n=1 Tax=Cyclobacterium xiamenense TaxID=1297121 RepID=A0A1H7BQP3_9BACT|nr:M48 family metallopeptidase [Cyclobacterium xiamenense]SEJ79929.1 STE24 endopeptidase [Cyclobacterium xiamenense]